MAIPQHIKRKLGKRLVSTTDRTGMFEGYRVLKREHEQMKTILAALVVRVKRLEGADSPDGNSPDGNSP